MRRSLCDASPSSIVNMSSRDSGRDVRSAGSKSFSASQPKSVGWVCPIAGREPAGLTERTADDWRLKGLTLPIVRSI